MINLLPGDIKEDIDFGRRNVRIRKYVGLTVVVAGILSAGLIGANLYGKKELSRLEREHAALVEKLGSVKTLTEEAKVLESKLKILKELFAKETNYVALLEDIEKTIVPGSQLQQLELNGDETKPLELRFIIAEEIVAATLRNSLDESPRFKFVDIQDITTAATDHGPEITVTYKLSYEPGQSR